MSERPRAQIEQITLHHDDDDGAKSVLYEFIRPFRNQLPHLSLHTNRSRAHACSLESKARSRRPCLNVERSSTARTVLTVDRLEMGQM